MSVSVCDRVRVRTTAKGKTSELVQAEVSKGAIRALSIAGVLVGLWVAACIVGGMIVSGGPIGLVTGWFSAVSGV